MNHAPILILGAGSGGISLAARLQKSLGPGKIMILDPAREHFYQPLWTLVGAGVVKKESTRRDQATLIPRGVEWRQEQVVRVHPESKSVECLSGSRFTYDVLVVATGLQLDFSRIPGVTGNLGRDGLCSIYRYEDAERTAEILNQFRGGTAIFTMPPVPIKCAGAPQKIMYLADEIFRRNGVRDGSRIVFAAAGKAIFGIPEFARRLLEVAARKGIELEFAHRLIEVRAKERVAIFEVTRDTPAGPVTESREMSYDLLHVVPPMSAHAYVAASDLAYREGPHVGWLEVDPATLQHRRYPEIFGIGDVTGVPNSKTGAAIRKQAPVVAQNILDFLGGRGLNGKYDGYSSCPLITGHGKVILAEFGYDGKLMPSFPMDMTRERRSMWILKKDLLPRMYWHGMLKGRL